MKFSVLTGVKYFLLNKYICFVSKNIGYMKSSIKIGLKISGFFFKNKSTAMELFRTLRLCGTPFHRWYSSRNVLKLRERGLIQEVFPQENM